MLDRESRELMDEGSIVTQRALVSAIHHYSELLKRDDLSATQLKGIVAGLNDAQSRLNKEVQGYDGQLAPRVEDERTTGMHTPLVRLSDKDLWEQL